MRPLRKVFDLLETTDDPAQLGEFAHSMNASLSSSPLTLDSLQLEAGSSDERRSDGGPGDHEAVSQHHAGKVSCLAEGV